MTEILVAVISLVISIFGFVFSVINYYCGVRHDRKQATIDAYGKLQEEALDKLNSYTPKQVSEISENPRTEEYKSLSVLLARCNHFSVGVNEKIYDEKILFRLAGRYFVSLYTKLNPLIVKKRNLGNKERYYADFETLAVRLNNRLSKKNKK